MKQLLFIGGTHGDEAIGVEALRMLEQRIDGFDWMIGNPPAFQAGTREFEGDLNRSAPGDPAAATYAKRRAAEILTRSKQYQWTIDLHGTGSATGIFVILTNPTRANLELALQLCLPRVVFWPSFSPELSGPLSEHVPCGLEIECGPKHMPKVREQLVALLEDFLQRIKQGVTDSIADGCTRTTFYEVYDSLRGDTPPESLEEFTETTVNGETFFPLLVGEYQKRDGIVCYKMRRIENPEARFVD